MSKIDVQKLSAAGMLITLGIIYGDIGTSPIYVLSAIIKNQTLRPELILGGVSCVFWTLLLITTFKYVYLTLNADNKGEGGIFALYALVRRYKVTWTIYPAIIGCATLIADGFITPPISISSAVEGVNLLFPELNVVPIVIVILIALFTFQQFGTRVVGGLFGPIMLVWFSMIAVLGVIQIMQYPVVLKAINPYWAINLLTQEPGGFWLLGAVLLCTTGGEALYSDLGHCGKENIRTTWGLVLFCLLLNYFGQSAFLLSCIENGVVSQNPFYDIMPQWFLPYGIAIATMATVIASQALITGSFSVINEGIKMRLVPSLKVSYPAFSRGQIYIPAVNWLLFVGCVVVVLLFREASAMQGAYGIAILLNMLMTTTLLVYWLLLKRKPTITVIAFAVFFYVIEGAFLVANVEKIPHGGWFALLISAGLFLAMFIFYQARQLRARHLEFVPIKDYVEPLKDLMKDESIAKEANNLVYLSMANDKSHIDSNIIYSIFRKRPKRADIYWFVNVEITDEPYGVAYSVDTVIPGRCFFVRLKFGFKVEHKVSVMFRSIVTEMAKNGEVDEISHYPSLRKYNMPADFKYIIINSRVSIDNKLSPLEQFVVKGYRLLKSFGQSAAENYGLELTNVEEESVPIRIKQASEFEMMRIDRNNSKRATNI